MNNLKNHKHWAGVLTVALAAMPLAAGGRMSKAVLLGLGLTGAGRALAEGPGAGAPEGRVAHPGDPDRADDQEGRSLLLSAIRQEAGLAEAGSQVPLRIEDLAGAAARVPLGEAELVQLMETTLAKYQASLKAEVGYRSDQAGKDSGKGMPVPLAAVAYDTVAMMALHVHAGSPQDLWQALRGLEELKTAIIEEIRRNDVEIKLARQNLAGLPDSLDIRRRVGRNALLKSILTRHYTIVAPLLDQLKLAFSAAPAQPAAEDAAPADGSYRPFPDEDRREL